MQDLTDVGIQNFSLLFISLAAVTDVMDVVSKNTPENWVINKNMEYRVPGGGVSGKPPYLQAVTRHGPLTL